MTLSNRTNRSSNEARTKELSRPESHESSCGMCLHAIWINLSSWLIRWCGCALCLNQLDLDWSRRKQLDSADLTLMGYQHRHAHMANGYHFPKRPPPPIPFRMSMIVCVYFLISPSGQINHELIVLKLSSIHPYRHQERWLLRTKNQHKHNSPVALSWSASINKRKHELGTMMTKDGRPEWPFSCPRLGLIQTAQSECASVCADGQVSAAQEFDHICDTTNRMWTLEFVRTGWNLDSSSLSSFTNFQSAPPPPLANRIFHLQVSILARGMELQIQ